MEKRELTLATRRIRLETRSCASILLNSLLTKLLGRARPIEEVRSYAPI